MPLWGPLLDFTGNYLQGLSLVPEMLTLMRLVTGTLGDLYRGVRRRLYLRFPVQVKGAFTPLLRRTR